MHERAGALEVREELVAQPHALARTLDQARDVGHDQLAPVGRLDRAEHRLQRRERIVGDLRPRVRDAREERRLARVRQPHQRRVGQQLQMQLDVELVARRADLGETRHLPGRRDEAGVAAAAVPAARQNDPGARVREVGDQLAVLGQHLRADRDGQLGVGAARSVLAGAAAVLAAPRPDLVPARVRGEIAQRRARDEARCRRRHRRRRRPARPSGRTSPGGS